MPKVKLQQLEINKINYGTIFRLSARKGSKLFVKGTFHPRMGAFVCPALEDNTITKNVSFRTKVFLML